MRTIEQIIEDDKQLDMFRSPLSKDWEIILFKVIDILHNLEQEGIMTTRYMKDKLLSIITTGNYNEASINTVIEELQNTYDELVYQKKYFTKIISQCIEYLYAVKLYHKEQSA